MSPVSDELRELYQEVILDHNQRPRNFGPLPDADHSAEGYNPLCGDQVTRLRATSRATASQDIAFQGAGCAISTASASLMTEAVKGKTRRGGRGAVPAASTGWSPATPRRAGRRRATSASSRRFAGVREFPVRVKCATLAWHTLRAALHGGEKVTTE